MYLFISELYLNMFGFVSGSIGGKDDGDLSDKENISPASTPPWLKRRKVSPIKSPIAMSSPTDGSDCIDVEDGMSAKPGVDSKHRQVVNTIRCYYFACSKKSQGYFINCLLLYYF